MRPSCLARTAPFGSIFCLFSFAASDQSPLPQSFDSLDTYLHTVTTRDTSNVRPKVIRDNGQGIDVSQASARTGQRSLWERAAVAGGRLGSTFTPPPVGERGWR